MLGGDLIWWREGAGVHTLVTLAWELAKLTGPEALELHFVLHDESGEEVHRWTRPYSPGDVIHRRQRSSVWSAEHFMAVKYIYEGRITSAAGW
jgi:hypothetical protein